jgi:hypothetical protein
MRVASSGGAGGCRPCRPRVGRRHMTGTVCLIQLLHQQILCFMKQHILFDGMISKCAMRKLQFWVPKQCASQFFPSKRCLCKNGSPNIVLLQNIPLGVFLLF